MAAMMAPSTLAIVVRSAAPWCGAATMMAARRSIMLAISVKCGYFLVSIFSLLLFFACLLVRLLSGFFVCIRS